MSVLHYGELTIRCHDGRSRICPYGLADELERLFKGVIPGDEYPRGPILNFDNGVRVRLFEPADPSDGSVVDLGHHKHIVLRGPKPGMSNLAPFVKGNVEEDDFSLPLPSAIQIIDTSLLLPSGVEDKPWLVQWPGFEPGKARLLLDALMAILGIQKKIRFRQIRRGVWRLHSSGERNAIPLGAGMAFDKRTRLRGSRYPWGELEEGVPKQIQDINSTLAHASFISWARHRGIRWKIKTRTLKGYGVEVTRLPNPVGFVKPLPETVDYGV